MNTYTYAHPDYIFIACAQNVPTPSPPPLVRMQAFTCLGKLSMIGVSFFRKFVTQSHFPASVMVRMEVIASTKLLVFVEKGAKVNAKMYQDAILKAVVEPCASQHFSDQQWSCRHRDGHFNNLHMEPKRRYPCATSCFSCVGNGHLAIQLASPQPTRLCHSEYFGEKSVGYTTH